MALNEQERNLTLTKDEANIALGVLSNQNSAPKVSLLSDAGQINELHRTYHNLLAKLQAIVNQADKDEEIV